MFSGVRWSHLEITKKINEISTKSRLEPGSCTDEYNSWIFVHSVYSILQLGPDPKIKTRESLYAGQIDVMLSPNQIKIERKSSNLAEDWSPQKALMK